MSLLLLMYGVIQVVTLMLFTVMDRKIRSRVFVVHTCLSCSITEEVEVHKLLIQRI